MANTNDLQHFLVGYIAEQNLFQTKGYGGYLVFSFPDEEQFPFLHVMLVKLNKKVFVLTSNSSTGQLGLVDNIPMKIEAIAEKSPVDLTSITGVFKKTGSLNVIKTIVSECDDLDYPIGTTIIVEFRGRVAAFKTDVKN